MASLHRMLRMLVITALTFVLLSLSAPSLFLTPSSASASSASAAVASASTAPSPPTEKENQKENEPGHVSDKSMNVDHESIRQDFEKIKAARDFYLQRTAALRRPHNCSSFVPKAFAEVLAPQPSDPTYNATAAAFAREILGSPMCAALSCKNTLFLSLLRSQTERGFAVLNEL